MKTITTILLLVNLCFFVQGQSLPDKISIVQNTYEYASLSDTVTLYKSDTIVLTNKRKISKLLAALAKYDTEEQLLIKFGIDTAFIHNNPDEVLKLYDERTKIDWNVKQKEYIFKKLNDGNVWREEINNYISNYTPQKTYHRFSIARFLKFRRVFICGMGMPTYRSEYVIAVYNGNNMTHIFKSRRSTSGYNFPYKDELNRLVYNYKIDEQLGEIFKHKIKIEQPLTGNDLLKYVVNTIVNNNRQELYKLSAYSYEKEISELSSDFSIMSSEEVYGRGRYIWDEPKTIKITLKNNYMLPNVYLQFLDSQYGETLYARDSIKKDYKEIISRVQAIPFIADYLRQDSSARLDIYYFNNSTINTYNIDGVNKNPTEWKKQDDYMEGLKWYEKNNIKPSFDIDEAIRISERNHCGCNYKFDSDFIKKAIFIEITSTTNASSIWFLLPDDTMLLYHVESYHLKYASVLDMKLDKLGNGIQLPFACLRFDKNGKLMAKK